ncbi:MAG: hypothetical protein WBD71_20295 [Xanthobacteraceae bacterium]
MTGPGLIAGLGPGTMTVVIGTGQARNVEPPPLRDGGGSGSAVYPSAFA